MIYLRFPGSRVSGCSLWDTVVTLEAPVSVSAVIDGCGTCQLNDKSYTLLSNSMTKATHRTVSWTFKSRMVFGSAAKGCN